ncbi:hypothetical protein NG831_03245 [Xanthomonas sacchari]|uniref:hypothetical protein n=1 Tax=Xanthomonas sacchari TaxID=56458 RepID=UPI00224ED276|nr:hypothetical protein [Xanthomonas sacchari]UYK67231.1 hypothetical protein NG831_03245 [Xanthomonas sacchari]
MADSQPVVGVCALAEGGDQLFAATVIEAGGSIEVVVPALRYETTFDSQGFLEYERLLKLASKKTVLNYSSPSEEAYMEAGKYIVKNSDVLLAAWDGKASRGLGGTGDVVAYARESGLQVIVIWPEGLER